MIFPSASAAATRMLRSRSTSNAPFVNMISSVSIPLSFPVRSSSQTENRVLISFRSESKAISSRRGCCSLISLHGIPACSAICSIQNSVGSPMPLSFDTVESLSSIISRRSLCSRGHSIESSSPGSVCPLIYTSCTVILFCVSVPVLSEQITDTLPRPSTA